MDYSKDNLQKSTIKKEEINGRASYSRILKVTDPLMYGEDVKAVQSKLNSLGYNAGAADGYYGNGTADTVRRFQSAKGLGVDGEVGPLTWNALFNSSSSNPGYSRILKVTNPLLMYGEDVKAVQSKLNSLGYNAGVADGYYGNGTADAVRRFQSAKGLSVDGEVGPSTWNTLFNSSSSNSGYSRILKVANPLIYGEDVKSVQNKLNSLGYNAGVADGYYGNATADAVRRFQSTKGLGVDGEVGPSTWNALFGTSSGSGSIDGDIGNNTGNIRKVFIDPGHGGSDPGASGNGIVERDKVLDISIRLGDLLKSKGIQVKYSRTSNSTYVGLSERAQMANNWGADIFVSIHANSFTSSSAYGTETYSYSNGSATSKNLAQRITNSISSAMNLYNRGAKTANFVVIRESNMPAVLVETAFVSNSSDSNKLKSNPQGFAVAIARGILGTSGSDSNSGSGEEIISKSELMRRYGNLSEYFGVLYPQNMYEQSSIFFGPNGVYKIKRKLDLVRYYPAESNERVQFYKNGSFMITNASNFGIEHEFNLITKKSAVAFKAFGGRAYIKIFSWNHYAVEVYKTYYDENNASLIAAAIYDIEINPYGKNPPNGIVNYDWQVESNKIKIDNKIRNGEKLLGIALTAILAGIWIVDSGTPIVELIALFGKIINSVGSKI